MVYFQEYLARIGKRHFYGIIEELGKIIEMNKIP